MTKDPYRYFRIEARELVGDLARGLHELDDRGDADVVARILRGAHTLKGAARIVKHRELAELAHALEAALAPLRDAPAAGRIESLGSAGARSHAEHCGVNLDDAVALVDRMTAALATLDEPAAAPAVAPAAAPRAADPPPLARIDTVPVDAALANLAGVHARLARLRAGAEPRLAADVDGIDRDLAEVRRDVERLRFASVGALYTSLERTARDAATATGKRVGFELVGADVRVDGQVLAALHGALVQLVRNAVVHGIEAAAARAAAGKPERGRVVVTVTARGPRIAIACGDDGRGLDLAAIRDAAARRGDLPAGELDAGQLFAVLLRGGVSTSREVSELAGRGIGLDVVRDAVDALGGEVAVATAPTGTTITLVVPVSIAALPVIVVDTGGRDAALPRSAVRRALRLDRAAVVRVGDTDTLHVDDVAMPCGPLAGVLGGGAGSRRADAGSDDRTVVVVDDGDRLAAVTVARVVGADDVVVRALPTGAAFDAVVWGVALDARGRPYPVVEPRALIAAIARPSQRARPAAAAPPAPILVVDDSLTTRMLEQSILEAAGFAVELAVSAEDALARLDRGRFALVLADVEMPGMDGFGLVATLRARPATAELPAILVTSRDAPADRARGEAVGAQGYIVKGKFDQEALLAMIRRLVP